MPEHVCVSSGLVRIVCVGNTMYHGIIINDYINKNNSGGSSSGMSSSKEAATSGLRQHLPKLKPNSKSNTYQSLGSRLASMLRPKRFG